MIRNALLSVLKHCRQRIFKYDMSIDGNTESKCGRCTVPRFGSSGENRSI